MLLWTKDILEEGAYNMSFSNLIKIAVSLKQLEDNSNRAVLRGKLDMNLLPEYEDEFAQKALNAIPAHRGNDQKFADRVKQLAHERTKAQITGLMTPGSHAAPEIGSLLKRIDSPVLTRAYDNKQIRSMQRRDIKNIPLSKRRDAKKIMQEIGLGDVRPATVRSTKDVEDFSNFYEVPLASANMDPATREAFEKAGIKFPVPKHSESEYRTRQAKVNSLRIPPNVLNAYSEKDLSTPEDLEDFAKVKKMFRNRGNDKPDLDARGRAIGDLLKDTEDARAFRQIVANHELNESNPKIKGGGRHTMISSSHASSKVPINDFNVINTLGKEAPTAQAIFRDIREREIDDMRSLSPGLNRLLEPMSGGEKGFQERISNRADQMLADNKAHNEKILSRVPEHKHSNPIVQARLKPTNAEQLREMAEQETRKSGRLNRTMQSHVANILDNNPEVHRREQERVNTIKESLEKVKTIPNSDKEFDRKFKIKAAPTTVERYANKKKAISHQLNKADIQRSINKARSLARK